MPLAVLDSAANRRRHLGARHAACRVVSTLPDSASRRRSGAHQVMTHLQLRRIPCAIRRDPTKRFRYQAPGASHSGGDRHPVDLARAICSSLGWPAATRVAGFLSPAVGAIALLDALWAHTSGGRAEVLRELPEPDQRFARRAISLLWDNRSHLQASRLPPLRTNATSDRVHAPPSASGKAAPVVRPSGLTRQPGYAIWATGRRRSRSPAAHQWDRPNEIRSLISSAPPP